MTKTHKIPGPDHPITIAPDPARVIIKIGGATVADTRRALTLREAHYPPVRYIPRSDVDMSLLTRSDHATYCPYKGDCAYYDFRGGAASVAWTYEKPYEAVASIEGHLAFYSDRIDP